MIQTEYQGQRWDVLGTLREDNLYPIGDSRRGNPIPVVMSAAQIDSLRSHPAWEPLPSAGRTLFNIGTIVGDPQPLPPGGRAISTSVTGGTPGGGDTIVGTCSKCRGPVCVPSIWYGTTQPVPTCQQCGAKKKAAYGPVIEME